MPRSEACTFPVPFGTLRRPAHAFCPLSCRPPPHPLARASAQIRPTVATAYPGRSNYTVVVPQRGIWGTAGIGGANIDEHIDNEARACRGGGEVGRWLECNRLGVGVLLVVL